MSEQDTYKIIESLLPTLITLEEYDKNRLTILPKKNKVQDFTLEEAQGIIIKTKKILHENGENVENFGVDIDNGLERILKNLNQSFDGKQLYPALEDKAANLIYLVIKDHPFLDGNKRCGVRLFVEYIARQYFMHNLGVKEFERGIKRFLAYDFTTLALQIALSRPEDKDIQIQLIIKLIQQSFREFYE